MRKLADGLQQPVARPVTLLLDHDQRLLDERSHQIENVLGWNRVRAADRLRRAQIEAGGKDA